MVVITNTLNCAHLNDVKAVVNIVTSSASTYLQLLAVSINDISGNPVEATFVNDSFAADNVNVPLGRHTCSHRKVGA